MSNRERNRSQETQESVFKNASGVPGRNTLSAVKTAVLSVLLQFVWCRLAGTKVNYIESLLFLTDKALTDSSYFLICPFHDSFSTILAGYLYFGTD